MIRYTKKSIRQKNVATVSAKQVFRPALLAALLTIIFASPVKVQNPGNSLTTSTLKGHAYLPALSLLTPPADAPRELLLSGKFITGVRNDQPMSHPRSTGSTHGNRLTGLSLPFIGQPLQGFSGFAMNTTDDGSVYALIDNGFGSEK